ncbi:MAG: hypothetical protein IT452_24300 [Planctomycetia bacterium]|nr:hypothetical protein [Planctomycetia bacterium]
MQPIQISPAAGFAAATPVPAPRPVSVQRLPGRAVLGSLSQLAGRTSSGLGATRADLVNVPIAPVPGIATLSSQPAPPARAIKPPTSSVSTSPRLGPVRPSASPIPSSLSTALQNPRARNAGSADARTPVPDLASSTPPPATPPGSCCIPGTKYECCCTGDPAAALGGAGAAPAPDATPGAAPGGAVGPKPGAGKAAYDHDYAQWQAGYTHFPPDPNDPKYGGEAAAAGAGEPSAAPCTTPRCPGSQRLEDPDNPQVGGWWYPGFNSRPREGEPGPLDPRGGFVGEWNRDGLWIGLGSPPWGTGVSGADGSAWSVERF